VEYPAPSGIASYHRAPRRLSTTALYTAVPSVLACGFGPLASNRHGIQGALTKPVSIGINMKMSIQCRFQRLLDDHLCHPVRDGRNPQRPHPASRYGYLYPQHRRRHIAAKRKPITELVEVASKVSRVIQNSPVVVIENSPPCGLRINCGLLGSRSPLHFE